MPFVMLVAVFAAIAWGTVYARRGSLVLGCGLLIGVSYVIGHEFWNARLGPLPLTLDRLLLLALAAAFAIRWHIGRLNIRALTAADWALAGLLLVIATSAVLSGRPDVTDGVTSKWGRLIASFVIPATLFIAIRCAPLTQRESIILLSGAVLFGVYLAVTAFCEVVGLWSLVYPRYIANPNLGIHFGRARGPELNSVGLGMYLTAGIVCAWTLLKITEKRWMQLAVAASIPLMAAAVFFTYTRSTWLGVAAAGFVIAAMEIPRRWRLPAVTMGGLCGLLVLAVAWSSIIGIEREGSAAESEHSVDQRKSFAYVSWRMFQDNPVFGVGFGRFYDRKLPYLSDRSQDIELESIRSLHHHNTFLSILTETGLVGLASFATLVIVWTVSAWRLARNTESPVWSRPFGVLLLALLASYLCSALFHDLTLLPSQQLLLLAFAAIAIDLRQPLHSLSHSNVRRAVANQIARLRTSLRVKTSSRLVSGIGSGENSIDAINMSASTHVGLFGMQISRVSMDETVDRLLNWCREPLGAACRYVVTPNVDHAVMYQQRADLRAAYADAALVLADGAPIVLVSRLLGRSLPERVAGSDLIPRLFESTSQRLRVFLLGAAPGVAQTAAACIANRWPSVEVVGTYSPPLGFENNDAENARILDAIADARPDVVVVGFGAPKQELWVSRNREALRAKVVICAGATIDFLAGHRDRSPVWMRRFGLEWLHRLCSEPRRLAARYARDAWIFPRLVWREWRAS